jgi:hypothetical protein
MFPLSKTCSSSRESELIQTATSTLFLAAVMAAMDEHFVSNERALGDYAVDRMGLSSAARRSWGLKDDWDNSVPWNSGTKATRYLEYPSILREQSQHDQKLN